MNKQKIKEVLSIKLPNWLGVVSYIILVLSILSAILTITCRDQIIYFFWR